jgi:hypothetical protein
VKGHGPQGGMAQYVTTHLWEQKHLLDSRRLSKARKQPIREVTGSLLIPNSFLGIVSLDKNREKIFFYFLGK